VFASAAAVGVGLTVAVDRVTGAPVGARLAGYAVAVPVAIYLLTVWLLHREPRPGVIARIPVPVAVALVLAAPLTPVPLPLIALILAVLVALSQVRRDRRAAGAG